MITGEMIKIRAMGHDLIKTVKKRLYEEKGVEIGMQRLIFDGRELKNERKLSDYHIFNGSTVMLVSNARMLRYS